MKQTYITTKRKQKVPNKYLINQIIEKSANKNLNINTIFNMNNRLNSNAELTIKLCSLNTHGFSSNRIFISELVKAYDIVAIQEHMCANEKKLNRLLVEKSTQIFYTPAKRDGKRGRFSGGLVFLVKDDLYCEHEPINKNISILKINKLSIFNIYLPHFVDNNSSNTQEYDILVGTITNLVEKHQQLGKEVIIFGDFNTDFTRHPTYGKILCNMVNSLNMLPADIYKQSSASYTFTKKYKQSTITSWIDHVFVNSNNLPNVSSLNIMTKADSNVSDHIPISFHYKLSVNFNMKTIINDKNIKIKQVNWTNPFLREFYLNQVENSQNELTKIKEEIINSSEEEKSILAAKFFNELTYVLIKANNNTIEYKETLKINKTGYKKTKIWWNDKLYSLHKFKCFKYVAYRESNWNDRLRKPYEIAKKEFLLYKKFIERETANKRFKRLDDLFNADVNAFWKEIKNMQKIKQMINVPLQQIRLHYDQLFNTSNIPNAERDKREEEELKQRIEAYNNNERDKCEEDYIKISGFTISNIISNLKNSKATGFSCVSNEMLKYGNTKMITEMIAFIMEWMMNNTIIPKLFNISILKPLIKDQSKGANDINNLRPLSISDAYTNIFEKIVLMEMRKDHPDHEKQFGFCANSSCSHATFVLTQTLRLQKQNNKTTYIVSIDASKAFDRVARNKLWLTLFDMKIRPKLILILKAYYDNFYIIVNNEKDFAAPFLTTYGVKQGGCMSPDLYKWYEEIIATIVTRLQIGVIYGGMCIDILLYADDIILLAPNEKKIQTMLDELSKFSLSHQIKFNPSKTYVLIFNPRDNSETNLILCGEKITQSDSIKYLGVTITNDYSNEAHIEKRRIAVAASIANLQTADVFNNQMSIETKIRLYNTYLKPLIYYGSEILVFTQKELNNMKKLEGNTIKKILGINKKCVSTPLYGALNLETNEENIQKHQIKFILRALENEYLNKFIMETNKLHVTEGLISNLNVINGSTASLEEFKSALVTKLAIIEKKKLDRYQFNEEVQLVKKTLSIKNSILRRRRIYELLYYKNYYQLEEESIRMN